ncbi:MAG: heterocyst frequency control protein PatD [Cyanobacteria bacterium P01_F01_bin.150]
MYQTLQQSLKKFQSFVEKWSTSLQTVRPNDAAKAGMTLMDQFKLLKAVWTEQQERLIDMELPQYGQALHTEMHKQFRLMEVDIIFLNTARQAKTIVQRKQQLDDRLCKLLEYCETGIKLSQQN